MDMPVGMIDLETCAQVVSNVMNEQVTSLGIGLGIMAFGFIVFAVLWVFDNQEKKLMKNFLIKEKTLNKYEEWKKDRRLNE
jgi:hypothetical protein